MIEGLIFEIEDERLVRYWRKIVDRNKNRKCEENHMT